MYSLPNIILFLLLFVVFFVNTQYLGKTFFVLFLFPIAHTKETILERAAF